MTTQLVICDTCAQRGKAASGAAWADDIRRALDVAGVDAQVVTTSCMNMCQSPTSFAVQASGKATYLFGDADPAADTEDVIELIRLYAATTDGWITDARTLGRLRQCLKGRVPPL